MKLSLRLALFTLFAVTLTTLTLFAQKSSKAPSSDSSKLLQRGKYLVEDAGQCQDCHSPRDEKGEYVRERWLMGSQLPMKPMIEIPGWMEQSPRIAGLPGFTDEEVIKFLTTGITPNGTPARPPMPSYRFSPTDAKAIVAYLRSLGKQSASAPAAEKAQ